MFKQLRKRAEESCPGADLTQAGAEDLPFEDDSFDCAVVTLVLCTVPDQAAALKEIRRVLRPGGQLLFLEHVRGHDPGLAKWQDRLERPWRFLGDGCHCNRDTVAAISTAGFEVGEVERGELPKAPPIVRPLVQGSARIAS
jgi:ubiquinone/menaquinone biosynthesis C-methylase UbiE